MMMLATIRRHRWVRLAHYAVLGFGLASILSEGFRRYSDLAQTGLGLFFLKYSRDNESESDMLGVEYSTKAGYDAMRMSKFFRTIARIGESSGSSRKLAVSTSTESAGSAAALPLRPTS